MSNPARLVALVTLLAACQGPQLAGTGDVTPDRFWAYRFAAFPDVAYGDAPEQTLDLFIQGAWVGEPTFFDRAVEPRPTLLFIHGGGWVVRDRRPEPWVLPFVERGWHVAVATYRLGDGTAPAAVDDAVCALRWLVAHADEHGFDTRRIVVAGVSAGGHLALTTGSLGSRPGHPCSPGGDFRVSAVVNWFGITDIAALSGFLDADPPSFGNYALAWVGDRSRLDEVSARYSPVHLVDAGSPPVLTIHGTDDVVVPYEQARTLHARLDELGVPNTLLTLERGTHAGFTDEQFRRAFAAMLDFAGSD